MMSGRDRISQLPTEILDNILRLLPIVEAARIAILSTIWRDCWSNLTQLNFDDHFFAYVGKKYSASYNSTSTCMYVIDKVLMRHHGPIHKFVLDFKGDISIIGDGPNSRKFDFDQWFLFITQKGVEDMSIAFPIPINFEPNKCFRLPNFIFSCLTLKWLDLRGVLVAPTINAPCIFLNVTSLSFDGVVFGAINLDSVIDVPMLVTLLFSRCENITSYFDIKAPRLDSLTVKNYYIDDDTNVYDPILPINLDLSFIHTLCMDFNFTPFVISELIRWGPKLNVECLELSYVDFQDDERFSDFIHSLRICPKLRELGITTVLFYGEFTKSILWEGVQSAAKMLKILHTFKLRSFNGSRSELQLIKMLLACFPALEKVVIICRMKSDPNEEFKIMQKLLRFPRASKKAKIVYR